MGKYAPLADFLRHQQTLEVPMTFAEIERLIGRKLPPTAEAHRAWWSNNPTNNVMTKAWLDAGFQSEQVDMEARKLVFRRVRNLPPVPQPPPEKPGEKRQHPLFGALRGLFRVAPGASLTDPADSEWGADNR
jgi:hypothetical protein